VTSSARLRGLRLAAKLTASSAIALGLGIGGALVSVSLSGRTANAANLNLTLVDLLAGLLPVVCLMAVRALVERRRRWLLRSALRTVVPPAIARDIVNDSGRGPAAAEQRTISVLFADLEDFTGFAERMPPEQVARVITEYLSAMSSVIVHFGGTVDKFIGDAVMAFWNAPQVDPQHAQRACAAAMEMQRRLTELNQRWQAEGLPAQRMRIGISTGPATVGYVGGPERLAYTALGSTVNLAARLEELNTRSATSVCIAESTAQHLATADLAVRFLQWRSIKGRLEPVAVYELLGDTPAQKSPASQRRSFSSVPRAGAVACRRTRRSSSRPAARAPRARSLVTR
jgi:adenylate cyclase